MSLLPAPLIEQLENALKQCDFSHSDCEAIRQEAAECWYLHLDLDGCPSLGHSRMGGLPDLPEGMAWPRGNSGALSFVMQIRLVDAPGLLPFGMPNKGMLYFFVEDDSLAMNVKHKLMWVEGKRHTRPRMMPLASYTR